MTKTNDGGPAFPDPGRAQSAKQREMLKDRGASLRDLFAAQALAGLCANPGGPFQANSSGGWSIVNCSVADVAKGAYDLSDAMLSARDLP